MSDTVYDKRHKDMSLTKGRDDSADMHESDSRYIGNSPQVIHNSKITPITNTISSDSTTHSPYVMGFVSNEIKETKSKEVHIRLDEKTYREVKEIADELGLNVSSFFRLAVKVMMKSYRGE